MRAIDGDALKRRAQKVATEAWKMELTAKIETTLNQFIDWINDAQTIEPERKTGKWIPCSERLPEYGVAVLTYDGSCYCVEKRIPTIRDDNGEPISSEWWVSDDYDERNSEYYPNLRDGACIAWMPLPEPYREERKTDERTIIDKVESEE